MCQYHQSKTDIRAGIFFVLLYLYIVTRSSHCYFSLPRCAKYTSIPDECHLEPDPQDPTCCKVASCPLQPTASPNPTPGYVQPNPSTPAPPMVTGIAPVPTPSGNTPAPVPGATTQAPMPKTGEILLNL